MALQDAAVNHESDEDQGYTTEELTEKLAEGKLTKTEVRKRLKAVAAQGRLMVGKKKVARFDGIVIRVSSYWIKPA